VDPMSSTTDGTGDPQGWWNLDAPLPAFGGRRVGNE
jgi:hypothetical protein